MRGDIRWASAAALALAAAGAHAQMLGPTEYLSFDDSPFQGISSSFAQFRLEDMEDHLFNLPGAGCSSTTRGSDFGTLADSVDADDGVVNGKSNDGAGRFGDSIWAGGTIVVTFNAVTLGAYPTHVGLVWTDGSGQVTFKAYDASNNRIGTVTGTSADSNFFGGTAEDRFYGVVHAAGISKVEVSNAGGIEADHFQYGVGGETTAISGTVTLSDWAGPRDRPTVDFVLRPTGGGSAIEISGVALGADGEFSFNALGTGEYEVLAKAPTFLRKLASQPIVLGGSPVTGLAFTLANGDVDGDNAVTVFDYNALSDAFDSAEGDTGWDPSADLDGDGAVTAFDYNIVSQSFDLSGDE